MVIPFNLQFFPNQSEGESFKNFAGSLKEALEDIETYSYSCNELQDLRVKFESPVVDAELWIEVMDMLPQHAFIATEFEVQKFLPSNQFRGLFLNYNSKFNEDKTDYSNLLPGIYRIVVSIGKEEKYYAFLKINPLRVGEEQLYLMREEIEEILSGLAKEIATKRITMGAEEQSNTSDILRKYNLLIEQAENLIANLRLILKEPRQKVMKVYHRKASGQATRSDTKTVKMGQNRPEVNSKLYSYNYEFNYDISYNQNLKMIARKIEADVKLVQGYLEENLRLLEEDYLIQSKYNSPTDEIARKIEIVKEHRTKLKQLRANLIFTLNQEWLGKINASMKNQDKLPRIPYYRTIYSVYRKLGEESSLDINPIQHYMYSWKETSRLYEIWGFLRLLMMLKNSEELAIQEASGWIFDKREAEIYPFLEPETKITLTNSEGLKLIIIYDSFIIKHDGESDTIENPLVSIENSNRPDFRVDIYHNGYFRGSILADFKYRSLGKLGNPIVYIKNREADYGFKVYSQLIDYTYTKSFYLNRKEKRKKNADFAVKRVLGIYPKYSEESISFIRDGVTNIVRCSLSPGVEFQQIEDEIIGIISECMDE